MSLKILDVGQCGVDGPRMKWMFESRLAAVVDSADTAKEAEQKLTSGSYDIVLVNRELNADRSSGIKVIETLRKAGIEVPMMLVSDYDEAQDQAVAVGAIRGFGKSALSEPETWELIQSAAKGS